MTLEYAGGYWAAAMGSIRSKASSTFSVRLKAFSEEGGGAPNAWKDYINTVQSEGLDGADVSRAAPRGRRIGTGVGAGTGLYGRTYIGECVSRRLGRSHLLRHIILLRTRLASLRPQDMRPDDEINSDNGDWKGF